MQISTRNACSSVVYNIVEYLVLTGNVNIVIHPTLFYICMKYQFVILRSQLLQTPFGIFLSRLLHIVLFELNIFKAEGKPYLNTLRVFFCISFIGDT
jgi:hypothetical protein